MRTAPLARHIRRMDATGSNQGWSVCAGAYAQREEQLNANWIRLCQVTAAEMFDLLLVEQRKRIEFKDLSCQYRFTGEFGREGQVSPWTIMPRIDHNGTVRTISKSCSGSRTTESLL